MWLRSSERRAAQKSQLEQLLSQVTRARQVMTECDRVLAARRDNLAGAAVERENEAWLTSRLCGGWGLRLQ